MPAAAKTTQTIVNINTLFILTSYTETLSKSIKKLYPKLQYLCVNRAFESEVFLPFKYLSI
jgi:hypothetical protein